MISNRSLAEYPEFIFEMFVLEESELLEDTISNNEVRELYNHLKSYEEKGKFSDLSVILETKGVALKFVEILLQYGERTGLDINGPSDISARMALMPEDKQAILEGLGLCKDDAAALALVLSGALLELFIIDNYTGPTKSAQLHSDTLKLPEFYADLKAKITYRSLTVDCCEVHHKLINPWLLKLSRICWMYLDRAYPSRKLLHLEYLVRKHRVLTVHLALLLDPVESIMVDLRKIEEFIFDHHILKGEDLNSQLFRFNVVGLCCELIQSCVMRGSMAMCRKFLDFALEHTNIEIEHTGSLGRRTKFQTQDIAQLVINVKDTDCKHLTRPKLFCKEDLPADVMLDDDTLLPDVAFLNVDGPNTDQLSIEAQLILLNDLDIWHKTEVMDECKEEYIEAYVRTILKHATIWSLKYKALALRSKTEKSNHRKMDRSLRQLESLINESSKVVNGLKPTQRQQWFHSVLPYSIWQMKRLLGDVSFELCLFRNALEVYEGIEYWEGIIKCHCTLSETVKAEKFIRQELEKAETPYLYCLLGDVTDDIQYYEKSWTLSNSRFSRAQKSIGTYYYVRKDLDKAAEHYELAHQSSPSNTSILAMLAFCCLKLERFEKAAEYYRKYAYVDDSSFLVWNNLSKAYIGLGQKERAWRTMREAIKCNYEEWRVWDNLLMLALDLGELDDVILAWNRLIEIKSSYKDDSRLNQLTHSILKKTTESLDHKNKNLLKSALELLGRIVSTSESSSRVWICYFKLLIRQHQLASDEDKIVTDGRIAKIANALQRATPRMLALEADLVQKPQEVDRIFGCFEELLDCYSFGLETLGPVSELVTRWKSFKLSASSTMKSIRTRINLVDLS